MKGVTFYAEYWLKADKRKKRGTPTVLAAYGKVFKSNGVYCRESVSCAIQGNRELFSSGAASLDYMRDYCTRISEAQARLIHPEIFNSGLL